MSFGFSSLGHVFASIFSDISKGAKAVGNVLTKVEAAEPVIESLTSIVYPPAVLIERAAFSVLGTVAATVHDAGTAADAGGLNVTLDAATVADIKALIATVKGDLAALGVTAPKATGQTVQTAQGPIPVPSPAK